jgi:hypothetical protein
MTVLAQPVSSKQCFDRGAMMRNARGRGLRTSGSRLLFSLNKIRRNFNLRRRRGFGSLHYGDARRSNRIADPIRPWHRHYESAGPKISCGYVRDQCLGIFFDWSVDDTTYRAASTPSQLAVPAGRRFPRRIYDILQLRMGDVELGQRRWPLARSVQCGGKCPAWIRGRLARVDHCSKALIEST